MKTLSLILICLNTLVLSRFQSCFTVKPMIKRVEINENKGVGPNAFLIFLEISDDNLMQVLEKCDFEFSLSPPISDLNYSLVTCYKMPDDEIRLRFESSLWADLSSSEIKGKELDVNNQHLWLIIKAETGETWKIEN